MSRPTVLLTILLFITFSCHSVNAEKVTTVITNEGNLDATISGNDASGTIMQSSDMNFDTNHFMNNFFGSDNDNSNNNNYFGNMEIDAGNIGASLRNNIGKEKIIQNKLANQNNNTVIVENVPNTQNDPIKSARKMLSEINVGNIHAAVKNAKPNNTIIQRNAANHEANYYLHN